MPFGVRENSGHYDNLDYDNDNDNDNGATAFSSDMKPSLAVLMFQRGCAS